MNNIRSQPVILFGSQRKEVLDWIGESIPYPCLPEENYDALMDTGKLFFIIFCPSDDKELEEMYSKAGRKLAASGVPSAVVLSFMPDSVSRFPIILNRCEFSAALLRRIVCFAGIHSDEKMNINRVLWERTGPILPFFIHNMNNILARIMGNIELAEFHTGRTDKVRDKLAIALEGTEELRIFLERLAVYSTHDDDDNEWTLGNEAEMLELGQMSSGTSVKFTYEEKSGMPRKLPISRNLLNQLTGLIVSSATVAVNGCGALEISVSPRCGTAEFRISWSSHSKGPGLCSNSSESAADMLTQAALMASGSGCSFRIDSWSDECGSASLLVPVSQEEVI